MVTAAVSATAFVIAAALAATEAVATTSAALLVAPEAVILAAVLAAAALKAAASNDRLHTGSTKRFLQMPRRRQQLTLPEKMTPDKKNWMQ